MIPQGKTSIDEVFNSSSPTTLKNLAKTVVQQESSTPLPDEPVSPNPVISDGTSDSLPDSEIGEKRNPTVRLFGSEIDRDSLFVMILLMGIWTLIWKSSGLGKTLNADVTFTVIFWLLILYMLISIKTSDTTSGGVVYELNILLSVEQMISILFGTVVLFALFGKNLPVHDNCRRVISQLSLSIIIILTLASMWVNVFTSGRMFRAVRKFKQGIYNIALALFLIIGLIFIKGNGPACA